MDQQQLVSGQRRIKRGWMNLRIIDIFQETHDTVTLTLEDNDEGSTAFDYLAGQYLTFRFDNLTAKPIARSYTLSSSPCQKNIVSFTVKKMTDGIVSNYLCDQAKVGEILRARGPIGKFCYFPGQDGPHLYMIAAGSGVTPFVSIMRQYLPLVGKPSGPQTMTLLVSYRSTNDLISKKELGDFNRVANVQVIITLSREDATTQGFWFGRIDDAMLIKAIDGKYQNTSFMTCGPDLMMDTVEGHLKNRGVVPEHIKRESFVS